MRIFWVSDAPWHTTGYGVTTKYIVNRMVDDGHEVFCYAPGAMHQGMAELRPGLSVLSSNFGSDRWGNQDLPWYIREFKPDLIITWLDCQGMGAYGFQEIPTYMWAPVDTWPIPQHEVRILNRATKLMVPSLWGQKVMAKQEIKADYIPCGIDLDVYDIDEAGRKRWRGQLKPDIADDTFLIGSVGINGGSPDRKAYGFEFDVIKRFAERHDNVRVYIHTNPQGDGGAINLLELRQEMGLEDVVCFSPPSGPLGATQTYLRDMYNAFDVLLHCGMCEGFGLPVVEAQACGTPVVFNSCTSMTEMVSPKVGYPAAPLADMIVATSTRIALPDVDELLDQLEAAYVDWQFGKLTRKQVRDSVLRYDQRAIYDAKWKPLLETVPEPFRFQDGPRKLMLAAGAEKKDGFVHHDREILFPHHDVAHDLNVFPYPWEDNSWDYIEFSDCLEHLREDYINVMDELWRITAPGGHVFIHTAEAGSWQLMMDPTHVRGFLLESMDYLDPETQRGATYSYSEKKWKVEVKTADAAGLIFIMSPRKEPVAAEAAREAVTA